MIDDILVSIERTKGQDEMQAIEVEGKSVQIHGANPRIVTRYALRVQGCQHQVGVCKERGFDPGYILEEDLLVGLRAYHRDVLELVEIREIQYDDWNHIANRDGVFTRSVCHRVIESRKLSLQKGQIQLTQVFKTSQSWEFYE